ncbi:phage tail protein [Yersinia enterocolitica]|uniref:phage tail tape measure protein n=1 Tax=Yersinia enterocolitica TaxID=630 RepID=UPI0005E573C2|nr:phage tail protein [Yersinia enterocolitica]EKN3387515.1 phage tail protein [Yersinia enterocolitica]EKN3392357.1 phage tail protein [Yersinia enterocolitica]EKN3571217.1 phage tail protein [Yersinia enterocolitica]EKN3586391.1 phage tail protein [Yersinia enterocolitica]EKN3769282.1 phage tail protein [Yersinia enterocolitica]
MASRLDTEIIINLAGNLVAKARQYGSSMSGFAQNNKRAMSVIQATSAAAGRGLDQLGNRYSAAIAGFAGGAMLKQYATVDRRLTRLGITADKTKQDMQAVFGDIQDVSIKFKVDSSEIFGAYEEINGRTGDLDFAVQNRENIGATVAGSGGSGESIGGLIAEYRKFLIQDSDTVRLALDGMNKLGKEGAFELKDMAEKLPASLSLYAAAGGKGVRGVMSVAATAEAAQDVTANRDKTATMVENFIRDLQNPKVVNTLKQKGVNVFNKDGTIRDLPTLLSEISTGSMRGGKKGGKGQRGELMQVGFGQESMDLIAGVSSEAGAAKLKTYMGVVADGTSIMADANYAAQDFTSSLQSLTTIGQKFANAQLAKPVQELADALNSVDQETVQNWLEIGKNVAITVGGLLAARKAYQIGKGAYDFLNPGKKGVPKGVTDVFGSGVMPVYVVNMGTGGLPTGGNPNGPKQPLPGGNPTAPPAPTSGGFWGAATRALTGGAMVYAQNELAHWGAKTIYDASGAGEWAKNSSFRAWADDAAQSSNIKATQVDPSSVWAELKEWINSTPEYKDPSPWASLQSQNQASIYPMVPPQLQGEIRVVVEGDARVKSVSMNQSGVTLSAQSGVRNVGQD